MSAHHSHEARALDRAAQDLPGKVAAIDRSQAVAVAAPRVVTVGTGEHQRTMRCLDLRALAGALLAGGTLRQAA